MFERHYYGWDLTIHSGAREESSNHVARASCYEPVKFRHRCLSASGPGRMAPFSSRSDQSFGRQRQFVKSRGTCHVTPICQILAPVFARHGGKSIDTIPVPIGRFFGALGAIHEITWHVPRATKRSNFGNNIYLRRKRVEQSHSGSDRTIRSGGRGES